jgi:photosystem II stability/assembly factor-like uncharacterized protein
MAIGVSHGGSNVYTSQEASTRVLVGTKDGVVVLERGENGWDVAARALPGLHVSSIAFSPNGTILAGAFFGAVYVSEEAGRSWEERSGGLTYRDVYSLAIQPLPDGGVRAYAGTEPANLFQSDDLGRHWELLASLRDVSSVDAWNFPAPPHVAHTKYIRLHPSDPNVIYACIEQGALLRTEDGGQTWREVNTLGFYKDANRPSEIFYDIHKLLIDPRDPNKLFVSGGAGLYVSFDAGASWERRMVSDWAKDVYPDGLVFDPGNPDLMFMSAAEHNPARWRDAGVPGYSGSRLYRSRDQGVSWQLLQGGLPDRMREEVGGLTLEAYDGGLQLFAATSAGEVWWSTDEGDNWSRIAAGLGAVSKKGHDVLLSATPINYQQHKPATAAAG